MSTLSTAARVKVKFERDRAHITYKTKAGKRVPGASTIAKIGSDPTALIHWAANLAKEGKDWTKVRDSAGSTGSLTHFMVQCHLRGEEADLSEFSADEQDKAANAFLKWLDWWQSEKLMPVAIEEPLVSEQHGYGGTIDLIAQDHHLDYVLLDWKTSNAIYREHILQTGGGYEQLWNENNPDKIISRRAIIRMGKTEALDLEVRWLPDMKPYWEAFKAQLALYRALQACPKNGD